MKTASIIMKDQADKSWIKTVDDHDRHWQEPASTGYKNLDIPCVIAFFTLLTIVITLTVTH